MFLAINTVVYMTSQRKKMVNGGWIDSGVGEGRVEGGYTHME